MNFRASAILYSTPSGVEGKSREREDGMRVVLRRHPVLALFGLLFFGLSIAVALAIIGSTSSSQTITPSESRRRPTIAGASPRVSDAPEVTVVPAGPVTEDNQLGKLPLFFFQAMLVALGIAVSIYVTLMVTGNF